jgi:hypothetical protein
MSDHPQDDEPTPCPKCGATSGDNWIQCEGKCPMPVSPHFDFSTLIEVSRRMHKTGADILKRTL